MTGSELYWILILDKILFLAEGFCVFTAFISLIYLGCFIAYAVHCINVNYNNEQFIFPRSCHIIGIICICVFMVTVVVSTLLPTTKQMVLIKVLPRIIDNEQVQNIGQTGLDLVEQSLEYLKEIIKSK